MVSKEDSFGKQWPKGKILIFEIWGGKFESARDLSAPE